MKTFLVVEKQNGGCDYTIGCGVKTYTVRAESYEALMTQVITFLNTCDPEYFEDNDLAYALAETHNEFKRGSVTVYEVAVTHPLNLGSFQEIVERRRLAAAIEEETSKERAELARLKEKFPNG